MAVFNHYPLQKAVYQALANDTALMASATGVFDRPPQGTTFPYVTLGESAGKDWSTKTTTGMAHQFVIRVWSREGGRKQAASIMERIHSLLHRANLTIEGQVLVLIRFVSSSIELENDGWTYHGAMHFQALLENNS